MQVIKIGDLLSVVGRVRFFYELTGEQRASAMLENDELLLVIEHSSLLSYGCIRALTSHGLVWVSMFDSNKVKCIS